MLRKLEHPPFLQERVHHMKQHFLKFNLTQTNNFDSKNILNLIWKLKKKKKMWQPDPETNYAK